MRGSEQPLVLLVDDEREECEALTAALARNGFKVNATSDDRTAQPNETNGVDLIISKWQLRGNGAGVRLVRSWRQSRPQTPIVAIVGPDQVEPAVEAMRLGVADCLTQPVHPGKLTAALRRILSACPREHDDRTASAPSAPELSAFEGMVGHSQAMRTVFDRASRVAPTNSTALLTGETGTGKELLAAAIHRLSQRSAGPLVAVNVAAIPNTLIESELFGHVKGAFTDAVGERIGRFEAADGGTLFIDEIADLGLPSQAKLLRVLETHVINRVGSNQDIPVDVRVIAATSRQLEQMVADGEFREDLYYRLNVVRIQLPNLSQRREDIPLLTDHFLSTLARKQNRPPLRPTAELLETLQSQEWPGNVRQLKNCLESMVVMSGSDVLGLHNLPATVTTPRHPRRLEELPLAGMPLSDLEMQAIQQTLHKYGGNRTRSAQLLGISVRTLQRKLKELNNNQNA